MTGQLVISLDFELMWGVRDHRTAARYGKAVLGGREAIPHVLRRFERCGIRATWATVGFLFARHRDEIRDHAPRLRPEYSEPGASPYAFVEKGLGRDEAEDPLHYGHSLVARIAATEGQEIATHSFSHFCCLEPGHSPEAFAADLAAARSMAAARGYPIRSIVFARNQMDRTYIAVAAQQGLTFYRGNPPAFAYRARPSCANTGMVRAARWLDSIVPVAGRLDYAAPSPAGAAADIPASRFLRPFNARFPTLSRLRMARILREIEIAARDGRTYHLWWHPHNMGADTAENLRQLDCVLSVFTRMRDQYGMESRSMNASIMS